MSEPGRTTNAYKERLARTIMGEAGLDLRPHTLVLGNGAYDSKSSAVQPPTEAMYKELEPTYVTEVSRSGSSITAKVTVKAAANPIAFNEIGLKTTDGLLIMHRTLPPQTLTAGITIEFSFELIPPEGV